MKRGEGIGGDLHFQIGKLGDKVDLPALGNPTKPTSAINFNSNSISAISPGFPGVAKFGA